MLVRKKQTKHMDTLDLNFMEKSNIHGHYGLKFHGQIKHMDVTRSLG